MKQTSLGRTLITPVILLLAGFAIYGLTGALIGAVIGIGYVVWVSRR